MARVKGIAVLSRLRFVKERYGDEGLERLLRALPTEERALVDQHLLPHAWAPFSLFVNVNERADALFGKGDLGLVLEMGAFAARVSLPTIFRPFLRFGSPRFLFSRASKIWNTHYDSGRLDLIEDSPRSARLRIEGFETPHRAHCTAVLGWAKEAIVLTGAIVQFAEQTRCRTRGDPFCEISARWMEKGEQPAAPA
jgi:hypothetical protein